MPPQPSHCLRHFQPKHRASHLAYAATGTRPLVQGLSHQPCAFTQPKRGDVLGVVPCAPVEGKASSLRLVEGRVVGPALKLQVEGQLPHVCAE